MWKLYRVTYLKDEKKVFLTFLEQTKDGAYAPIAESSLSRSNWAGHPD